MSEIKVYIVVNSGSLILTERQWQDFFGQANKQIFADTVLRGAKASQNFIDASKRSLNSTHLLKNTLLVFEVSSEQVQAVVGKVDEEAAKRGLTGDVQQKFVRVLQAELREAARGLGLTLLQANQITMNVVGFGERNTAITQVQTYLRNNANIWYENTEKVL